MLNGLDLFSGIGGITLALSPWVKPVAYCESDRFAQGVLLNRISDGSLPNAPIWDDVTTLRASEIPARIDIIYGGFPCQDVSAAGLRKGLDGERTGLFRQAIRLVRECEPKFVFLENVPGIRRYVPSVRQELEALGYDCRDGFLSAAEVGANHTRNRWWLLAYANGGWTHEKQEQGQKRENQADTNRDGSKKFMANAQSIGLEKSIGFSRWAHERIGKAGQPITSHDCWGAGWWAIEPNVGRVANGVPARVDRLRGLGNAVVPFQAQTAFKILAGLQ